MDEKRLSCGKTSEKTIQSRLFFQAKAFCFQIFLALEIALVA
jgi:hypothetical protein